MNRGYIKLYRKLSDHKIWLLEPFTKGQAWVDLLFLANHKGNSFVKRGIVVDVKRGQVGWSEKALSLRWKWSRSKVTRFLKYLKNEHQIEHQKNKITLIITILNYDEYNTSEHQNEHQTNIKRTSNEHQTNTNKNDKHYKHEENVKNNISHKLFEQLWKDYPRKLGKKNALRTFLKTVKNPIDEKNIQQALENFKIIMKEEERKPEFVPHGSTWFSNWQDWTEYKTKSNIVRIPLIT